MFKASLRSPIQAQTYNNILRYRVNYTHKELKIKPLEEHDQRCEYRRTNEACIVHRIHQKHYFNIGCIIIMNSFFPDLLHYCVTHENVCVLDNVESIRVIIDQSAKAMNTNKGDPWFNI